MQLCRNDVCAVQRGILPGSAVRVRSSSCAPAAPRDSHEAAASPMPIDRLSPARHCTNAEHGAYAPRSVAVQQQAKAGNSGSSACSPHGDSIPSMIPESSIQRNVSKQ